MLRIVAGCRIDTVIPEIKVTNRIGKIRSVRIMDGQMQGYCTVTTIDGLEVL